MLANTGSEETLKTIESNRFKPVAMKKDGYRIIFHLKDSGNLVQTRSGKNVVKNVPKLATIVPELHDTVLDGEGFAPTGYLGDSKTIFGSYPETARRWQEVHGSVKLLLFDCVKFKGLPLAQEHFSERRKYLQKAYTILRTHGFPVQLEKLIYSNKSRYYKQVLKQGEEGVIIKELSRPYTAGKRTDAWLKVKPRDTYDFVIMDFTQGTGKYSNMIGAVVYGGYLGGELVEIGRSSGMTDSERLDMTKNPNKYIGKVAEFEAQGLTKYGVMRHPEYLHMRPDKNPIDCQVEDYL